MFYDFDSKELESYKGFDISKCWRVDSDGNRIKKYSFFYLVSENEDYISEDLTSLKEAKKFIDNLNKR